MAQLRITIAVAVLLRIFLDDAAKPWYGYELMRRTGFASGKLYPIRARLEAHGWLDAQFEDGDPVGRPTVATLVPAQRTRHRHGSARAGYHPDLLSAPWHTRQ